jgi:hypothetical protein
MKHTSRPEILAVFALPAHERPSAACRIAASEAHQDIRETFHQWDGEKRKALSRLDCQKEGGWGPTSQIEKEKSGALRSFLDGKKRLISTSSFYEHLITRLILSHPADATPPKGTQTRTRFRKSIGVEGNSGASCP